MKNEIEKKLEHIKELNAKREKLEKAIADISYLRADHVDQHINSFKLTIHPDGPVGDVTIETPNAVVGKIFDTLVSYYEGEKANVLEDAKQLIK